MRHGWAGAGLLAIISVAGAAVAGVDVLPEQPAIPAAPEIAARNASLRIGHAEVLRFPMSVGTIVVGDAGVIDATAVNDSTVILTALAAGQTNVLVLGQDGAVLTRLNIGVGVPQGQRTTVYRGTGRSVLVCSPECVPLGEAGGDAPAPGSQQPAPERTAQSGTGTAEPAENPD